MGISTIFNRNLIEDTSSNGPSPIAMLDYWAVMVIYYGRIRKNHHLKIDPNNNGYVPIGFFEVGLFTPFERCLFLIRKQLHLLKDDLGDSIGIQKN